MKQKYYLRPQDVPHPMINGSATLVAPDGSSA